MDYSEWWPLHTKSARGEPLTPDERTRLETAYRELDADEKRALAPRRAAALSRIRQIRRESAALRAEIRRLEAALPRAARRALSPADDPS